MILPGQIALIGSGETAARGGQVFDILARHLRAPVKAAVLETPAGFELNSAQVAGRVADYLRKRLQNYQVTVQQIPARKRGTGGTDDWEVLKPLMESNLIFMGPGSPTYTVRQLQGSLAWELMRAKHRMGAVVALASAATVAVGVLALPVYEIFKVGEDPTWKPGLNLLGDFGIQCVVVPHWNNTEGGSDVDTGRCFIGQERFEYLLAQLPSDLVVIGIDEHSGLIIDPDTQKCHVTGRDGVHILRGMEYHRHFCSGDEFSINLLGDFHNPGEQGDGIEAEVWRRVVDHEASPSELKLTPAIPEKIADLMRQRKLARDAKNWIESDRLRDQINALGWMITDTPDGQLVTSYP